jgi:hypothetical protein
MSQTVGVSNR